MSRELSPLLCDNLERCDGVGGGREAPEGGHMCIPMADSCHHLAETNMDSTETTLRYWLRVD